jgi:hypothetical protein
MIKNQRLAYVKAYSTGLIRDLFLYRRPGAELLFPALPGGTGFVEQYRFLQRTGP